MSLAFVESLDDGGARLVVSEAVVDRRRRPAHGVFMSVYGYAGT